MSLERAAISAAFIKAARRLIQSKDNVNVSDIRAAPASVRICLCVTGKCFSDGASCGSLAPSGFLSVVNGSSRKTRSGQENNTMTVSDIAYKTVYSWACRVLLTLNIETQISDSSITSFHLIFIS